jgi:hypothetical protein
VIAGLPAGIGRQTKTPRDLGPRGVCLDLFNRYLYSVVEPEPQQELHGAAAKSTEI